MLEWCCMGQCLGVMLYVGPCWGGGAWNACGTEENVLKGRITGEGQIITQEKEEKYQDDRWGDFVTKSETYH